MLGYCGINCSECRAYKGTVTGNVDLLKEAAGAFWNGTYDAHDWVCLGCGPHNQHFLAKYCSTCRIRVCAEKKGVQNCAACENFEKCSILRDFVKGESEDLARTLGLLRERYLAAQKQAV